MERVTRIELALSAWEADVLPLNYTRMLARLAKLRHLTKSAAPCGAPVQSLTMTAPSPGPSACSPNEPRSAKLAPARQTPRRADW